MKHLWLLILLPLLTISCKGESELPEPLLPETGTISVDVEQVDLLDQSALGEVTVTADCQWTAKVVDESGEQWLKIAPDRGQSGTTKLIMIAMNNESYDSRSTQIIITAQTEMPVVCTLTVNQMKRGGIILSKPEVEVPAEGGNLDVELKSNVECDIIIDGAAGWVKSSIASNGLEDKSYKFNIEPNFIGGQRSASVIFKERGSGVLGAVDTLFITQLGMEPGVYRMTEMGSLGRVLSQLQKDTIRTMTILGPLNTEDFRVMNQDMPKLQHLNLLGSVCENNTIPDFAFSTEMSLTGKEIISLVLPQGTQRIGNGAFAGCHLLSGTLVLPAGLTEIGTDAFRNCDGLSGELIMPQSLKTIGAAAFLGCFNFSGDLIIPSSVTSIGHDAFVGCSGFTSVALPADITNIAEYTFENCIGLTGTLTIPATVISIEQGAFNGCSGVARIRMESAQPIPYIQSMLPIGGRDEMWQPDPAQAMVVEVPSAAAEALYRAAEGWNNPDNNYTFVVY